MKPPLFTVSTVLSSTALLPSKVRIDPERTEGATMWVSAQSQGTSPAPRALPAPLDRLRQLGMVTAISMTVATAPAWLTSGASASFGTALPLGEETNALLAPIAPRRSRRDPLPEAEDALFAWCIDASVKDLRMAASSASTSLLQRGFCMRELAERDDPWLASYVVSVLGRSNVDPALRDMLLDIAEVMQVREPALRDRLEVTLLRYATELRDSDDASADRPLWAALRRYASLVPPERVSRLLEFLRPTDVLATRQVALQGIQSAFSVHPPADETVLAEVQQRAHTLAAKYLDADWLVSAENNALALNAFCASAAAADPELLALTRQMLALRRPRLCAQAAHKLHSMTTAWRAALPSDEPPSAALLRLEESLTLLTAGEVGSA